MNTTAKIIVTGEYPTFSHLFSFISRILSSSDNSDKQILDKTGHIINEYIDFLKLIEEEHFITLGINKKMIISKIFKIKRIIKCSTSFFLKGDVFKAVNEINKVFSFIDLKLKEENAIFYRGRAASTNYLFNKREIFHIPLNRRHLVKNQRFSLSGFPCLYLGEKSYTCWEELERPDFGLCNFVSLTNTKSINFLDLSFPIEIKNERNLLVLPIIIACSLKAQKSDDFKSEYIIPQLILHNLIKRRNESSENESEIIGLIYHSTSAYYFDDHIFTFPQELKQNDLDIFLNYVIPVINIEGEICPTLRTIFKMSEAISNNFKSFQESRVTGIIPSSEEDTTPIYQNSCFSDIDNFLNGAEKSDVYDVGIRSRVNGMIAGQWYLRMGESWVSGELPIKEES